MTIKQQGGVFGRNPTFNNIDVDGSATFDGSTLVVDGVNNRVGINSPTPRDTLEFKGIARLYDYSGQDVFTRIFTDPSGKLYIDADKGNTKAASGIVFTVDNVEAAQFNSSGNLAFPAGQGIDFSATSGTGTSELFDDYEEGTWTPADASAGSLTLAVAEGIYTKIGRLVNWQCVIRYPSTADTNVAQINGFPFALANPSAGRSGSFVTTSSISAITNTLQIESTPTLRLYKTGFVQATNAEVSGGDLYLAGFYTTS